MSTGKGYTDEELRFFRLAKCVVDHSSAALRKVFKQEWNNLYRHSPWLDNRTSGSELVARETSSSRLNHPSYCADYKHIKDKLEEGNVDEWDVTALNFVLKFSEALNPIRCGFRWKKIDNAIFQIKEVRNRLLCHSSKASLSGHTFERNVDTLMKAVEDLLTRSDPLVGKLETLRNENDFTTDGLLRYIQMLNCDLLLLEEDLKKLEGKIQLQLSVAAETRSPETSHDNGKIISRIRLRVVELEQKVDSRSVDLFPSHFKPAIFRSARYIQLINKSHSLSYNFRWHKLKAFFPEFDDDFDMKMFAAIQSVLSLSHQSRKKEALDILNSLIPKVGHAKHGVVLLARIKIHKAYILHDQFRDEEAMREANEAEVMLLSVECHEDRAELHNALANIVLSTSQNAQADRKCVLLHLEKCIHYCREATVDKSVAIVQATLRKALAYLGYYQHGILENVSSEDVKTAETTLKEVSEQSEPLSERSKVYYTYGQALLAYRKGNLDQATKLEHRVRGKCELHEIGFEIQQLDMLKTLIRGSCHRESKTLV